MDCSKPGLPVRHQLLEFSQTRVHWVSDAIQPAHPLSFPSPPVLSLSQHQGLFKWVNPSRQVAKVLRVSASTSVLPMNTQDWSPLVWTGWISLQSKGLSRVFSNTTVQKHQLFSTQLSLPSSLTQPYMTTGKTVALPRGTFVGKVMSLLFNMLYSLVVTFYPSVFLCHACGHHLQWFSSPPPPQLKSATVSTVPYVFAMKWWHRMPWSSFSECLALSQLFHSLLSLS